MGRRTLSTAAVALSTLVLAGSVGADGVAFPEVAVEATPAIPHQRALIVHRNGVETLVVESAFDTGSAAVGWVLPLPGEPTKLDVADGGMFASLAVSLGPKLIHDIRHFWQIPAAVLALLAPGALAGILARKPSEWVVRVLLAELLGIVGLSFIVGLLGTAATGPGAGAWGVEVAAERRVGNYDASVLRAADSGALSRWLAANSFRPLRPAERQVVDDYIARKWCFVVARLGRAGGGLLTPHPIAATFRSPAPVYPMKLTGLAGSSTQVDLFVVADGQGRMAGFDCIAAARFRKLAAATPERDAAWTVAPYYGAEHIDMAIGSPDASERMWDGCVVTHLRGTLRPSDMRADLTVELAEAVPFRVRRYTRSARRDVGVGILLSAATVALGALAVRCWGRRRPGRATLLTVACLSLVATAGSLGVLLFLPASPARASIRLAPLHLWYWQREVRSAMELAVAKGDIRPETAVREARAIPGILKGGFLSPELLINPFTGEEMRLERSCGNFAPRVLAATVFICLYDDCGRELRLPVGPLPKPLPPSQPAPGVENRPAGE